MTASITNGNTKLGPLVHAWSIPAISTCPGSSGLCRQACYAGNGFYNMPNVAKLHKQNYEFSQTAGFVGWSTTELRRRQTKVLRWHTAGDVYSLEYALKIYDIVSATPDIRHFMYTRSWRTAEIYPILRQLGQLPNMGLWWSTDRETGPAPLDANIRQCYLALSDEDAATVPYSCDLVFRDNPKTVAKSFRDVLVCPTENGVTHASGFKHTCSTCQLCFNKRAGHAAEELKSAHTVELRAPTVRRRLKGKTASLQQTC